MDELQHTWNQNNHRHPTETCYFGVMRSRLSRH